MDAAPVINGRSLAVSGGRVFFRASEAEGAQRLTERVSLDENDALSFTNGEFYRDRLYGYTGVLTLFL